MQVAGHHEFSLLSLMATGARVSNAYPTFPPLRDSPAKAGLISDVLLLRHLGSNKDLSVEDGDASD